jgi:hypothetical protein
LACIGYKCEGRGPANKFAGYTLRSPPTGTGYMAKSFHWGEDVAKAVRRRADFVTCSPRIHSPGVGLAHCTLYMPMAGRGPLHLYPIHANCRATLCTPYPIHDNRRAWALHTVPCPRQWPGVGLVHCTLSTPIAGSRPSHLYPIHDTRQLPGLGLAHCTLSTPIAGPRPSQPVMICSLPFITRQASSGNYDGYSLSPVA